MINKTETTFWAKIYMAGSIETIKNVCRAYCLEIGLCVTVKEVLFIYTGGEEYGVEIGLINYPRFPESNQSLLDKATALANRCREAAYQHSYLIMTPELTKWSSTKEQKQ